MYKEETKVFDLLTREIDADVADEYDERLYIGYVGPVRLTDLGKEEFKDVLNYTATIYESLPYNNLNISIQTMTAKEANRAKKFFEILAGYCPESEYNKYVEDFE